MRDSRDDRHPVDGDILAVRTRPLRHAQRPQKESGFSLGPGIVSGASDNDPTTVATLAVVGSTTVYGLAWLVILVIPMLAIVQAISAQVGAISRKGLEDCVRFRYGSGWAFAALLAILAVNVLTLAADLEGGASALRLLTGIGYRWWLAPLAIGITSVLVFWKAEPLQKTLQYVALVFFAYVGAAFLAHPDWGEILRASIVPHFEWNDAYISGAIALLGTTLTSYAYVWETIETSEKATPLRRLGLVQVDAIVGIVFAGLIFWFIIIATGATLGVHHHTVQTAEDAAEALRPIAGPFASAIFGAGLLASALIALPVLAGTCAYVMAEMFRWRRSLDETFARAKPFYVTLIASMAIALAIAFAGLRPIQLLFYSGIAGGIATPFTLALMMLVARDRKVMGHHPISPRLAVGGWIVTAIVTLAVVVFLYQTFRGGGS